MKINEKQLVLLKKLLINYDLTKDIHTLTKIEASIAIEGILNKGKVKKINSNIELSDSDYENRQKLFDDLVKAKSIYASEKQMNYIRSLCKINKFEITNDKIIKKHVNNILLYIRDNNCNDIALQYVTKIKEKTEEELITVKEFLSNEDSNEGKENLFPSDWILYNVNINGRVDF